MLALTLDLSGLELYLQRPDILLLNLLYWVGWVPIAAVLIYGFFEVWLFNRQERYRHHQKYTVLAVDVPKETEQSPKAMEHFFAAISSLWGGPNFKEKWIDGEVAPVISLELVSDGGYIQYYIRTPTKFRDIVEAALYSAYPDVELNEVPDYTHGLPTKFPDENYNAWGCEQSLRNADYFPIRTYEMFEHKLTQELKDPLGMQLEQFAKLKPGEMLWTQYILEPLGPLNKTWHKAGVKYIWKEVGKGDKDAHKASIFKGVTDVATALPMEILAEMGLFGGGGHDEHAKEEDPWKFLKSTPSDKVRLDLVTQKIGKAAMHVKIRHVYIAKHAVYNKGSRDKMLKAVYSQYTHQDCNAFGRVDRVTPKHDYFWQAWFEDTRRSNVVKAYEHRDPERGGHHFILNTEELATLWHFPAITTRAPFVSKTLAKRAEPPVQLPTEIEGAPDMVSFASDQKSQPTATPVDFGEPNMPGRPSVAHTPSHDEPVHHEADHGTPHLPEPAHQVHHEETLQLPVEPEIPHVVSHTPPPVAPAPSVPVVEAIPDSVRALFDPGVEFNDAGFEKPDHSGLNEPL